MTIIEGVTLEFGVYPGRTLSIISKRFLQRPLDSIHLMDYLKNGVMDSPVEHLKLQKYQKLKTQTLFPAYFKTLWKIFL
jgi:hypothetical protein